MWKYICSGFVTGFPARDISAEEYQTMDKDMQNKIAESGLYELVEEKKNKKPVVMPDKES